MQKFIQSIPDFPKQGVIFQDIFPLLKNNFAKTIDELSTLIPDAQLFDYVAGIESRGFILASALAYKWQKGLIPIRKKGKLPPPTVSIKISLEYGEEELEMPRGNGRLLLVDDVIATGGTLDGAIKLAKEAGYEANNILALIYLKNLNTNLDHQSHNIYTLFNF